MQQRRDTRYDEIRNAYKKKSIKLEKKKTRNQRTNKSRGEDLVGSFLAQKILYEQSKDILEQ